MILILWNDAYRKADLAVVAMEKAGKNLTVDRLIESLESIKGYRNPFGGAIINFSSTNHRGSNESLLLQIQDGKWLPPNGNKIFLNY